MKCANCGKELSPTAKFCNGCGTPVETKHHEEEKGADVWAPAGEDKESHPVEPEKKKGNDKRTLILLGGLMLVALIGGFIVKGMTNKEAPEDPGYNYADEGENQDMGDSDVVYQEEDSTEDQMGDTEGSPFEEDLFAEGYLLPGSDTRYLTIGDLEGLTAEQCRIARNEIYARHGRMFDDETLQAYFLSQDWYRPTIKPEDFKEDMLNTYETANRDFIVDYEEAKGYR